MAAAARDTFTADFDEARRLADDAFVLLNERRDQLQQNADASVARLTAASRRKLNALGSKVASLEAAIGDDSQGVSAKERDRRRDMVARLKTHNTQLTELLSRKDAPARAAGGAAAGAPVADERPRETLETAERDELGLLVLQRDVIAAQDAQLDDLSRTVTSVRHIACAVNEELDLQSRLLVRACPRRVCSWAPRHDLACQRCALFAARQRDSVLTRNRRTTSRMTWKTRRVRALSCAQPIRHRLRCATAACLKRAMTTMHGCLLTAPRSASAYT